MITLDDYLADQLHDPDFRTHFINEMAKHVRDGSMQKCVMYKCALHCCYAV